MAGKVSGRIKRAISSSLILFAVAGVLAVSNIVIQNRDRDRALGPQSKAQHEFFADGVDRPDISVFFKNRRPAEKLQIARNLRRYDDPKLVKLAVKWLTDFDVEARKELQGYLTEAAPKQPKALADQLTATGGFQKLAVAAALRSAFQKTLPFVIEQLSVAGARANAVEYLVASGKSVAPSLLPVLDSKDKDTRLAAADALGKLGYRPAGPALRGLYASAPEERSSYLAALANLGDPESIEIFREQLADADTTDADRASAVLGLGRIGDKAAVEVLWKELAKAPFDKRQIIESLSVAGDESLESLSTLQADRIEVAGGLETGKSDLTLMLGVLSDNNSMRAAELSHNRPAVVPALNRALKATNPGKDGRKIEVLVGALASTQEGLAALKQSEVADKYRGFIERELSRSR